MSRQRLHIVTHKYIVFFILLPLLFVSCSPTRHLPSDKYLFNNSKINFKDKRVDPSLLKRYERITPNKRIAGLRFHLFIYNLSNPDKNRFPGTWFRKIGEAPVVYDSNLVKQNTTNFSKYLSDIGYSKAVVDDSIIYRKKNKIDVFYNLKLGLPTRINSLSYSFEDTSIQRYIYADTADALIKKGMLFNKQLMQTERLRLEKLLKNNGYYKFSKEYIYYEVSDSKKPDAVNVSLNIKQNVSGFIDPVSHVRPHKQYTIDNVYIIPDIKKMNDTIVPDTILYNHYKILYVGEKMLRPSALVAPCRIRPGQLYSQNNIDKTYSNLSDLSLFRFINIKFSEADNDKDDEDNNKLECKIDLAMRKRQALNYEIVGTNSALDLGARGNITYNNYNLFRGGEYFQFGVFGAYESLEHRIGPGQAPMKEIGFVTRLETPKFLFPFISSETQRKFSPRTAFQFSYNNQRQPKYRRTIANASFGYIWKGNSYNRHSLYPVDFSLVKIPYTDSAYFENYVKGRRIEYSYINHTILALRYVFEFNTQSNKTQKNYLYFRASAEQAGAMVSFVNKHTSWGKGAEDSLFFGVQFAQYVRGDVDFRYYNVLNSSNKMAYRFYAGIGIPYGNSKAMPFEKMFWSGGPYGIRAWSEADLGPGSVYIPDSLKRSFRNQLGDIKLEGNLEYRFKLLWKLEGALFVDAGNIWSLKGDTDSTIVAGTKDKYSGVFYLNNFYNDIAIGAGFGLRFDLSFVLIRADFGFKVRDPARLQFNDAWINQNDNYRLKNATFQFGIGYPF